MWDRFGLVWRCQSGLVDPLTSPLPAQSPAVALGRRLNVLRFLFGRSLEDSHLDGGGQALSYMQLGVLRFLAPKREAGGVSIGAVAAQLGVRLPSASRTVSRLEAAGLVQVLISSQDKRQRTVQLTDQGQAAIESSRTTIADLLAGIVEGQSSPQVVQWTETLDEIIEALLTVRPEAKIPCLRCTALADGECLLQGSLARCPAR